MEYASTGQGGNEPLMNEFSAERSVPRYADVYVGYPVEGSFTYQVPEHLDVRPGMRVKVHFRNRMTRGYVHHVHDQAPDVPKLKFLDDVIDDAPVFDHRLVDLARYMANSYVCETGEAMSMALPSGEKPSSRFKHPFDAPQQTGVHLTEGQQNIYENILAKKNEGRMVHLLYGITGSGKTEIYIKLAQKAIEEGRSVIYLVPEISLSSQIYQRLYQVFGEQLVVYHSHLTKNQRLYNWKRFFSGEVKIVIGTRSAIFLQAPDTGLIIIDEEHDSSYKEHSTPRYNARRLAFYRVQAENSMLLLGSATPSVESLYAGERGQLILHRLEERFGKATLPQLEIVKLHSSRPEKMISPVLTLYTKKAVERNQQAILLLNRRGFSPVVVCDECGHVLECPSCSISLTSHGKDSLLCHYCGFRRKLPHTCPECGSEELVKLGSGTQRLEEVIQNVFRDSAIFRLDHDSARKKGAVYELMEKMKNGDVNILLGTQMVAKGFDFHNVSVVGIILADVGMNLPDFRAQERIFSLLMQVSGRCGRGDIPGKVVVQTLNEEQPVFDFLRKHDYMGFYRYELEARRALGYPPFARLARLLVRGMREDRVIEAVQWCADMAKKAITVENLPVQLVGPSPAPLTKIAKNYRHHIILKSTATSHLAKLAYHVKKNLAYSDVYLEIDIDPYDLL